MMYHIEAMVRKDRNSDYYKLSFQNIDPDVDKHAKSLEADGYQVLSVKSGPYIDEINDDPQGNMNLVDGVVVDSENINELLSPEGTEDEELFDWDALDDIFDREED
jgi:hypothetical protein